MDKKIFEMSVAISDIDQKLYYDCNLENMTDGEHLLQTLQALSKVHNALFEMYLKKVGIETGDDYIRFS